MPRAGALAELVGGTVIGDDTVEICDVADLDHAGPNSLSFVTNPKYVKKAKTTRAGALLVAERLPEVACAQIVCANPYLALAKIGTELNPPDSLAPGIEPSALVHAQARVDPSATVCAGAVIERGARIGAHTVVGPLCFIGAQVRIGADTKLYPGVKILTRCVVGDRVILHAGVVIGSDGFGFAPDASGRRIKIPQLGIVEIGDDVEIGANTTLDRATFGATRIGAGTKIDNLVQIGHNCRIGRGCLIVSQVGIAGSTTVGDHVVLGGQVGIAGHLHIGDGAQVGAQSGIMTDVEKGQVLFGSPARPHREAFKLQALIAKLPEMHAALRDIRRKPGPAASDPSQTPEA